MNNILEEGKGPFNKRELCFSACNGKKYATKLIVHADTFTESDIKFYVLKKRRTNVLQPED